jgi:hypothetical protein
VAAIVTYFVANLLGVVSSLTGGALSVNAKDSDCTTPVMDFSAHIVDAAPATAGLQELKQWQAVASYFSKLPDADADGIPDVPTSYKMVEGRIGARLGATTSPRSPERESARIAPGFVSIAPSASPSHAR